MSEGNNGMLDAPTEVWVVVGIPRSGPAKRVYLESFALCDRWLKDNWVKQYAADEDAVKAFIDVRAIWCIRPGEEWESWYYETHEPKLRVLGGQAEGHPDAV